MAYASKFLESKYLRAIMLIEMRYIPMYDEEESNEGK